MQEVRNRLIKAAQQLAKVQEKTRARLVARGGSYGSSYLYIVDEETGEEINYQEALLLQPVEEGGEEIVSINESKS